MDISQEHVEEVRPPLPPGPIKWIKDNLFNSWVNSLLTVVLLPVVFFALIGSIQWVFISADWRAVSQFPLLYAVGQYPRDELWRVGVSLSIIAFLMGASWGKWGGLLRSIAIAFGVIFAIAALLPVTHPALSVGMRLYLASTVLLIFIGFLIGRLPFIKSNMILIGWVLVAPVKSSDTTAAVLSW